jgi:hypothetical protein
MGGAFFLPDFLPELSACAVERPTGARIVGWNPIRDRALAYRRR